jgi:hypothetical protein
MRVRTALLVGAVLLAGLGLAGAATAAPIDGSDHETNETTNTSGSAGAEVGICVTGVDSPCNGQQWDGDRSTARTHEAVMSNGSASVESGFDVGALVRLVGSVAFGLTLG